MADFNIAVEKVLAHEGGYDAGLPGDSGGETNFGISKRSYPDVDIKNLTRDGAIEIYRRDFWKPYMEQELVQALANCAFDCAVNQGPLAASQIYLLTNPSLREFQLHRLLRYTITGKSQFYHAWFSRCLDV